ncbi:hypothetical protein F4680DRAFT_419393 [Xylaria scruposa]|nr:hypothetical protein F4680DRAFT_419393 [Xylaria scruposa]
MLKSATTTAVRLKLIGLMSASPSLYAYIPSRKPGSQTCIHELGLIVEATDRNFGSRTRRLHVLLEALEQGSIPFCYLRGPQSMRMRRTLSPECTSVVVPCTVFVIGSRHILSCS